jgi:hypothetical protein
MLNQAPSMLDGAFLLQGGFAFGAWILIITRILRLRRTSAANREFRAAFLGALNLRAASEVPDNRGAYARIANVGFGILRHTQQAVSVEGALQRYTLLIRNLTQQAGRERDALAGRFASLGCVIGISFVVGLLRMIGDVHAFDKIGLALTLAVLPAFLYLLYQVKAICAGLDDFANDFLDLTRQSLRDDCDVLEARPAKAVRPPPASPRLQLVTSSARKVSAH